MSSNCNLLDVLEHTIFIRVRLIPGVITKKMYLYTAKQRFSSNNIHDNSKQIQTKLCISVFNKFERGQYTMQSNPEVY